MKMYKLLKKNRTLINVLFGIMIVVAIALKIEGTLNSYSYVGLIAALGIIFNSILTVKTAKAKSLDEYGSSNMGC